MNKNNIIDNITRGYHKVNFKFKKHSPEILMVFGIAGVVTSTIMACKATTKVETILKESKHDIDIIHSSMDDGKVVDNSGKSHEYTLDDEKRDLTIVYVQTGIKLVKLYTPSVILGTLSLTAMISSNNILRKRNIALAAAYTAVDKSFKEYRERVIERFGKELDKELRLGIKSKNIETIVKNEDGTEDVTTETVNVAEIDEYSDYAKCYDDGCTGWSKDPEYNLMFLKRQQAYANDVLKAKGYLFLNDVYDMLGIPRTKAGQIVGWIYDEKNPVGDNYVDFGIYDINKKKNREFVNGYERTIWLDFNVDGNILDMM